MYNKYEIIAQIVTVLIHAQRNWYNWYYPFVEAKLLWENIIYRRLLGLV